MNTLSFSLGLAVLLTGADVEIRPDRANELSFDAQPARFVRFVIYASSGGQPCIDELELYGEGGKKNLALAARGAKATASSCLPGYAIHQIAHLNDGRYGNSFSWIAAGTAGEWAQIELPESTKVAKVVFSRDRAGRYSDRLPIHFEIRLSTNGKQWKTVGKVRVAAPTAPARRRPQQAAPSLPHPVLENPLEGDALLRYAFLCEAHSWWKIDRRPPVSRVLTQLEEMIERFAAKGLDVTVERAELAALRRRQESLRSTAGLSRFSRSENGTVRLPGHEYTALFFDARGAKRRLLFREPDLAPLARILFVKRHAFRPSHNYSVILDAAGGTGGAVCILEIPGRRGRLEPAEATLLRLFESGDGIARNPMADFDAGKIYFGYRQSKGTYYHIMVINADGSGVKQLTDGPFHDYWPCPLPDGGIAFISTRCKARYLCWRPQVFVLFRMEADGRDIRPLSHANLSEWTPSVSSDGRIIWMRSEYLDKGADFGHTLWMIRPDGTHPELVFGNDTLNCYANGREVPGTGEICCTLVSHGGDLNGPIALLDLGKGRFNPAAITSITPDVRAHTHMSWARRECFRDPVPIARDYFLCSHAPQDRFGLYVIDRFGNREILHLDPAIDSMCPTPFRRVPTPPVLHTPVNRDLAQQQLGQFILADVYQGIEPAVKRGTVKYLRVCQELRAELIQLPNGEYQNDHRPFQDWYATPIHKVSGPYGWPSYVAKASWGIVPVEEDGSANFLAPAGKVLYFQALDQDFNELQRMRSVVQLQPGEKRSCIGCHENRQHGAPVRHGIALKRQATRLQPPPWGAGPFSYEKVVQRVWDAKCVRCHDAADKQKINLTGTLGREKVPASYRTVISRGWVHYFDYTYGREHTKAAPLSFGTVKSKLWQVLDKGHYEVKLSTEEMRAVKCWIDLNCPLWGDYIFRGRRPARQP